MNFKQLAHLAWLIPIALGVLLTQQAAVLYGIQQTYTQGEAIEANITDFRIKQIAAQTNGYVDLQFLDTHGNSVEQRLSLHAQHASRLIGANQVEIRYLPDTTYDIVIASTYSYHRSTVLINIAVLLLSALIMGGVATFASRYALRKKKEQEQGKGDGLQLEFINTAETASQKERV